MSQLIACPECSKQLQVPENLLGQKVQCPECKHAFTAVLPEIEIAPAPSRPVRATESKTPAWDKKKRTDDREEDDDRSERRRKRRDEDDDDEADDRPRRRASYSPHRGGMILAFGIIGLVTFIPIFPHRRLDHGQRRPARNSRRPHGPRRRELDQRWPHSGHGCNHSHARQRPRLLRPLWLHFLFRRDGRPQRSAANAETRAISRPSVSGASRKRGNRYASAKRRESKIP